MKYGKPYLKEYLRPPFERVPLISMRKYQVIVPCKCELSHVCMPIVLNEYRKATCQDRLGENLVL